VDAGAEIRSATDLSVLMAGVMSNSLTQRGLNPPGAVAGLTTAAQVAAYLKQAQQISKDAAGDTAGAR